MAYSLCPDLNISRLIVTSAYSIGRAPSLLSMVSVTSARPSGGREVVPAKTTSSILPPRRDLAPCSPITQDRASTMLDLPEPFGPTTQVMPGSRRSEVAGAKALKPRKVSLFRNTCSPSFRSPHLIAPRRPIRRTAARIACRPGGDSGGDAEAGEGMPKWPEVPDGTSGDSVHLRGRSPADPWAHSRAAL